MGFGMRGIGTGGKIFDRDAKRKWRLKGQERGQERLSRAERHNVTAPRRDKGLEGRFLRIGR